MQFVGQSNDGNLLNQYNGTAAETYERLSFEDVKDMEEDMLHQPLAIDSVAWEGF